MEMFRDAQITCHGDPIVLTTQEVVGCQLLYLSKRKKKMLMWPKGCWESIDSAIFINCLILLVVLF